MRTIHELFDSVFAEEEAYIKNSVMVMCPDLGAQYVDRIANSIKDMVKSTISNDTGYGFDVAANDTFVVAVSVHSVANTQMSLDEFVDAVDDVVESVMLHVNDKVVKIFPEFIGAMSRDQSNHSVH
jgi:hypothetical protein